MTFTAASLAASIYLFLNAGFEAISKTLKRTWCLLLVLIYPVAMYPASRGDTAFILLICLALVIALEARKRLAFVILLGLLTLSRADLALFAACFALIWNRDLLPAPAWAGVVALPLAYQATVKYLVFPDAEYYVDVVMLHENLRPSILLQTPMFAIVAGVILIALPSVIAFTKWPFLRTLQGMSLIALIAMYMTAISIVAIIAETRLFVPLAPFILLLVQAYFKSRNETNPAGAAPDA